MSHPQGVLPLILRSLWDNYVRHFSVTELTSDRI